MNQAISPPTLPSALNTASDQTGTQGSEMESAPGTVRRDDHAALNAPGSKSRPPSATSARARPVFGFKLRTPSQPH